MSLFKAIVESGERRAPSSDDEWAAGSRLMKRPKTLPMSPMMFPMLIASLSVELPVTDCARESRLRKRLSALPMSPIMSPTLMASLAVEFEEVAESRATAGLGGNLTSPILPC